jgi:hypothetical protein
MCCLNREAVLGYLAIFVLDFSLNPYAVLVVNAVVVVVVVVVVIIIIMLLR